MTVKEMNMLKRKFLSNWSTVRKFISDIKKKFHNTYLNVFLRKSYNKYFIYTLLKCVHSQILKITHLELISLIS